MKKQKSIKLAVPQPCSESWNNMSPNGNGRHCSSCEKTVIDFSKLSDSEIFEALAENNSKVCGRFSAFQLNRSIFPHIQINHSIYPKVLLGAALATCSIYPAFSQDSFAKILTEASQINNKIQSNQPGPEFGKDSTKYIKGKIVDSKTGEPVPFATILIKELKTGAVADLNGNFKIEVKDSFPIYLPLTISALAYDETQLMLHKNKLLDFIEIKISPSEYEIVGDVIIIDDTKSKKKSQKKNKRP